MADQGLSRRSAGGRARRFLPHGGRAACEGARTRVRRLFAPGRAGESGFALVYVLVLFGVFVVILASSVSHQGSAQALNIQTGQRRKALDLARGVVDEMLSALFTNGFDLSRCPNYSQGSGTSTITQEPEDTAENWIATATAGKGLDGFICIVGEARLAGVSETVQVKLEPCFFLDLYSDGVIVAADDVEVEFKNKAQGLEVHGNIYAGDELSIKGDIKKVEVHGQRLENYPVRIPEPKDVKRHVEARIDPKLNSGIWYELDGSGNNDIVVYDDTIVRGDLSVSNRKLLVEPGAWLHVKGDLKASGHSKVQIDGVVVVDGDFKCSGQADLRVDGVLIVRDGSIKINPNDNVPVSGSGIIITLSEEEQKFTVGLGEGERGGLCLISVGEIELTVFDTPQAKNSLFVYAEEIEAIFKGSGDVILDPCRFISVEDTEIEFKNSAGNVHLHAGGFDWKDYTPLLGGSYRIVDWAEGKAR